MRKVKFAVIGVGHIGKRHIEMIERNEQAELVATCDILGKEQCNATHIEALWFVDYQALLNANLDIDVVNICVPNGLHAAYSIAAIEKGYHVVVEKPMALSRRDAEAMVNLTLKKSKHLFCVMQNRYSPPSVWLKSIIDDEILGKIFMVEINCFWNRDNRYYKPGNWHGSADMDGGPLFTQFSHFIDIMFWLFGDIENIKGNFNDFNHQHLTRHEDTGNLCFNFKKEGMGILNYSTSVWDCNLESSMTIIGENGTIKVAGQYMNEVVYCHVKNYAMPELEASAPPNDYGGYKGSAQNHHLVIQNVIDKINGHDDITTNAFEGLKVVDIIERIYKTRDLVWTKTE